MTPCSTCGNEYDAAFEVTTASGETFVFDSIECAAARIAPRCEHCACTVLGHGVQVDECVYCCAACSRHDGAAPVRDRVDTAATS